MDHLHVWQKEPPDGIVRTSDDRYGDMRDLAHNSFWTSPEEVQELRLVLEKEPDYENSKDWPMVVEWCSSCAITRGVKLVLPEEEENKEVEATLTECKVEKERASCCEATARDAGTQTPRRKKRKGGRGSRMRRLLAFQLMLTKKKGLPLSRLLAIKEADSMDSKREELRRTQAESASPTLKVAKAEEKEEKIGLGDMKKEAEGCFSMGASAGDSTNFTPRSSQPDVTVPTSDSFSLPASPPHLPPPPYIWLSSPPFTTFYSPPPCGLMPGHQWLVCGTCHSWGSVIMS